MSFRELVLSQYVLSSIDLHALAKTLLKKYWPDKDYPGPAIKVRNNINSKWHGRCVSYRNKPTTLILLQKSILGDEPSLRRVMAHELIHHVSFIENVKGKSDDELRKFKLSSDDGPTGHGRFFKEQAAKINALEGKDYVTETSDGSLVVNQEKEYFILIRPKDDSPNLTWQWAVRITPQMQKWIDYCKENLKARLTKTRNSAYLRGQKIKDRNVSFSVISKDDPRYDFLKELYDKAK